MLFVRIRRALALMRILRAASCAWYGVKQLKWLQRWEHVPWLFFICLYSLQALSVWIPTSYTPGTFIVRLLQAKCACSSQSWDLDDSTHRSVQHAVSVRLI